MVTVVNEWLERELRKWKKLLEDARKYNANNISEIEAEIARIENQIADERLISLSV